MTLNITFYGGSLSSAFAFTPVSANLLVSEMAPAVVADSWSNISLSTQTGAFTCEFDAIPTALAIDNLLGLSNGPATAYANLACILLFTTGNVLQVRNGASYGADATVSYAIGQEFHVRMSGNVSTHTYSVWITPEGQNEVLLASNYAFRSDQSGVTQLNNFGHNRTTVGNVAVSNLVFSAGSITRSPASANLVASRTAPFVSGPIAMLPASANLATSRTVPTINTSGPVAVSPASANLVASRVAPTVNASGGYPDGFAEAPVVSTGPQFPDMLDLYRDNGITWPWHVAGADYPVGVTTDLTLNDLTTSGGRSALPAGTSADTGTKTVTVTGNNVTLNGFLFGSDWKLNSTSATGTLTVTNCRFIGTIGATVRNLIHDAGCSLVVKYCEFNQSKRTDASDSNSASAIQVSNSCTSVTIQHCWFHGLMIDAIGFNGESTIPVIDVRYNLFSGLGFSSESPSGGGHPDAIQTNGLTTTDITFSFNTLWSPSDTYTQSNNAFMIESQYAGSISGIVISNNTAVLGTGGVANYTVIAGVFLEDGGVSLDNAAIVWNMMDKNAGAWPEDPYGCYTPMRNGETRLAFNNNFDLSTGDAVETEPPSGAAPGFGTGIVLGTDILSTTTAVPSSGTITVGQSVVFTAHFNRRMVVTGTPYLTLSNGAQASYSGGTNAKNIEFTYTVAGGDTPATGLNVTGYSAGTGGIKDQHGNTILTSGITANFASITIQVSGNVSRQPAARDLVASRTAPSIGTTGPVSISPAARNLVVSRTSPSVSAGGQQVPMPSLTSGTGLALRPIYTSGDNTLRWEGPTGGGASNGDYSAQSRTLSAGSNLTTTSAGQTIEGRNLTGATPLTISHNNVVVRQCRMQITPINSSDHLCISIDAGITGTVIEDCELDANSNTGSVESHCVSGDGFEMSYVTVRRCYCHGAGQVIRMMMNNISFTENYCDLLAGEDSDQVEAYPNGGVCNHFLIQYNVFDGTDNSVKGCNSAINLSTAAGLPAGDIGPDISIDSNWFMNYGMSGWLDGHDITIHVINNSTEENSVPGYGTLQFSFTNNGYYRSDNYGSPGGATNKAAGGLITPNSGNYIMTTATSRSGSLINGDGQL